MENVEDKREKIAICLDVKINDSIFASKLAMVSALNRSKELMTPTKRTYGLLMCYVKA